MITSNPVLKVDQLETTFFLKSGPFKAVNRISYEINQGQTLGIVGESGCGKSVTSFSLMQLIGSPGKITHGTAEMKKNAILTDGEIAKGFILTCQAHPTSAELYVDYDDV